MQIGMYSQNYARRKSLWSASHGGYMRTSLGSKTNLDSDEEDTSSVSEISTQSVKSYKTWRRAQRQKRQNLKRAMTLDGPAMEALDLGGNWNKARIAVVDKLRTDVATPTKGEAESLTDNSAAGDTTAPPTVAQSPLEPYYSSSPLTSSSSDTEDLDTPLGQKAANTKVALLQTAREPHSKSKDPLERRPYPFILPTTRLDIPNGPKSLDVLPPPEARAVIERKGDLVDVPKGLNDITSLARTAKQVPSLLEIYQSKTVSSSMENTQDSSQIASDVPSAEINGLTVTVLKREAYVALEHQTALQTDPGKFFLPPLMAAKASKNKECGIAEIRVHEQERSDLSQSARPESYASDLEITNENVYMENAEDIFNDLQEREFIAPAIRALPESDTSSIATRDSVDPIEEILTREDDVPADEKTFTMNGRAVVKTGTRETIHNKDIEITIIVAEESAPSAEKRTLDIPQEKQAEVKESDEPLLKRVHSHKVGKGKNCPVCKKKEEMEAAAAGDPEHVVIEEVVAAKAASLEEDAPPKAKAGPIRSHKVGDNSECQACTPGAVDVSPALCCAIL